MVSVGVRTGAATEQGHLCMLPWVRPSSGAQLCSVWQPIALPPHSEVHRWSELPGAALSLWLCFHAPRQPGWLMGLASHMWKGGDHPAPQHLGS